MQTLVKRYTHTGGPTPQEAGTQLNALARQYQETHPYAEYREALARVSEQNPTLHRAYTGLFPPAAEKLLNALYPGVNKEGRESMPGDMKARASSKPLPMGIHRPDAEAGLELDRLTKEHLREHGMAQSQYREAFMEILKAHPALAHRYHTA